MEYSFFNCDLFCFICDLYMDSRKKEDAILSCM